MTPARRSGPGTIAAILAAALLLASAPAWAAIAVDGASSGYVASGYSVGWQHTVGAGANLLLVGISYNNVDRPITWVRWNGADLTRVGRREHSGTNSTVEIWALKNPQSGTYDIHVYESTQTNEHIVGGAVSFSGVDPGPDLAATFGYSEGRFTSASNSASRSVSGTAAGQYVFDTIAVKDNDFEYDPFSCGQELRWERYTPIPVASAALYGAGSTKPATGSPTVMTWDSTGDDTYWLIGSVVLTAAPEYRPDAQIKLSSEAAGSYLSDGVYEATASTQSKSQGVISGSAAVFDLLFQNDSTVTDGIVITQAAAENCTDFTIRYLDGASTDRTASVVGSGYTISGLAPGASRAWTLSVTPPAAINGSAPACAVRVTAASSADGTKTDQVRAETASISASLTLLKSADRATVAPGQDIVYTIDAASGSGLTDAGAVVVTDPIPTHTGFRVGSASFAPGTSTLSGSALYSSDNQATWSYSPTSGGCSAPPGYDYCVTHIRWTTTGSMPAGTSFSASFAVGVK